MITKLLRINAKDIGDYDEYHEIELTHEEVELTTLMDQMNEYELANRGYLRVKDKLSKQAIDGLKKLGWVHADSCKNREEKKILEQEFYILDEKGREPLFTYDPKFKKIDLDDLHDHYIVQLAKGARIVQKVSLKSVLRPKDYEKLLKEQKKLAESQKKKKETAKKKAETIKQKEIEKAKKILQEAGLQS